MNLRWIVPVILSLVLISHGVIYAVDEYEAGTAITGVSITSHADGDFVAAGVQVTVTANPATDTISSCMKSDPQTTKT